MLDEIDLEQVDRSIEDRQMSVGIQPASDIRRRYETDGKRQIENSRSKPMAIKVVPYLFLTIKPYLILFSCRI